MFQKEAMSELKALLLTDVVGSTQLSERLGDESMVGVWAAHDRAARDLLPVWRGREIDKTDGMLLLFDAVADAIGYARACQRALAALPVPLPARAGIHFGPVILRENSAEDVARGAKPLEVDGLAKPTAARVMSLARGGQLLLTPEAREALGATELHLHSHGHWILKGVSEPVELFEVRDDGAPGTPPEDGEKAYRVVRSGERWLPVREIPNNLPQQTTTFIGRERELGELKAHLAQVRLLTLLGMGGLGKTRLSLQVAAEVMPQYPDGVWFLDLAPMREPALVVSATAQVLGLREEPDRPLIQTLCGYLKTRRVLFVMDNCEHLVKAAAELANAILRAAPQARFIASSREALRVPGEQSYPVLPLPVPRRDDSLETLIRSTAVRLFVDRAQLHKPAFALDAREAPAVAELVARLEGIPLALELAAARVRTLTVADINARLKDRYKILTGGGRVLLERQQTLRALVDWSYDLLQPKERTLFGRLGVFVGGFDLAAAEAVCGADPLQPEDVLDIVESLVEKSLLTLDESDANARYRMLDTIREYAREKLEQGGDAAATAARHCGHFLTMAKAANVGLEGADHAEWIWRLEAEIDNVRAATALALTGGVDRVIAVKFAVALQGFWILRGYAGEGRNVVRAALALPEIQASDRIHAHALYVGAALAESQSDYAQARQMLEPCLRLRRGLGEAFDIAATLSTLAMARLPSGDAEAARECDLEALKLFRELDATVGEAIVLLQLGQIDAYAGEVDRARASLEEGLQLSRKIHHQEVEGECELCLGELAFEAGDVAAARERFQRSLIVCSEGGDRRVEARNKRWLGKVEMFEDNLDAAERRLNEALQAFRQLEMREDLLACLDDHSALAARRGNQELAVQLAAAVDRTRDRMGLLLPARRAAARRARLDRMRAAMGSPLYDEVWAIGSEWDLDHAAQRALAMSAPLVPA